VDELRFKIDAFRPDTIPMARLAEYMKELAALLGNEHGVHFVRLDPGSVELVQSIDKQDRPKVDARLDALRRGDGATDAIKAYRNLDDLLANDNAIGTLSDDQNQAVIIQFPGKTRPKPVDYGAFSQPGSFDGVPIKVGGKGEQVAIHLQETGPAAQVHICQASRDIARAIAAHLFETTIRVHGMGKWRRDANGWGLLKFTISDFEVLDDTPLDTMVARLRGVPGNGWREVDHPLATLNDLRGGEDSVH